MKIKCPACSQVLSIADSSAGKVVQCPCGKQLKVPGGPAAPSAGSPSGPQARGFSSFDSGSLRAAGAGSLAADEAAFDQLTERDLQPARTGSSPYAAPAQSACRDPLKGYAPPSGPGYAPRGNRATVGQRIVGALIDSFAMFAVGIGLAVVGYVMGSLIDSQNVEMAIGIAYFGFYGGIIVVSIINAVLISSSGQSMGKKVVKTRITDRDTGAPSGFVQGFLVRNFLFGLITGIPCVGALIGLADLIMLFPEPNETLHDKLAKTVVVQA